MTMKSHQQPFRCRSGIYWAVACSLLGVTRGGTAHWSRPLAFASPSTSSDGSLKRENDSNVRLFSRGPDTQLSAATLAWTGEAVVADPFDPDFRPSSSPFDNELWGPPTSTTTAASTTTLADVGEFQIFCDLDGVLVDFEAGVQKICQQSTAEIAKQTMWRKIAQSKTAFFQELPWTRDGPQLWDAIRHLQPTILTGVPDLKNSRMEKFKWCVDHLGMEEYRHVDLAGYGYRHSNVNGNPKACPQQEKGITNIITCWSYNKHNESGSFAVLIDDRIALKESWEARGGIFVHHTDTDSTLRQLTELGVLDTEDVRGRKPAFLP